MCDEVPIEVVMPSFESDDENKWILSQTCYECNNPRTRASIELKVWTEAKQEEICLASATSRTED